MSGCEEADLFFVIAQNFALLIGRLSQVVRGYSVPRRSPE
jgi:hypothetical protein